MKRIVLAFWIVIVLVVTIAYAAIQGDFVINGVDATTGTKFYRVKASVANGLLVDVSRVTGTVNTLITNTSVTVNGTVSVSSMPTVTMVGNATPADAFANPTTAVTVWSLRGIFNGTTWDRDLGVVNNADDIAVISTARVPRTVSYNYGFDGTAWDRTRVDQLITSNSTATTLASNGTFTGTFTETLGYAQTTVMVLANVASATGGVKIQHSSDGTNIDYVTIREYTDNVGNGVVYTVPTRGRYVRVIYTNGGTIQATFRLQTILRTQPSNPAIMEVDQTVGNHVQAMITKSTIIGKTTAGGGAYVDVKVNPSGALVTATPTATSATVTAFTGTTATTTLLAANDNRTMIHVYNEGSATLYIKLGSAATTTSYTVKMQPESYWEMANAIYTGIVTGIWSATTATTMVTEY